MTWIMCQGNDSFLNLEKALTVIVLIHIYTQLLLYYVHIAKTSLMQQSWNKNLHEKRNISHLSIVRKCN